MENENSFGDYIILWVSFLLGALVFCCMLNGAFVFIDDLKIPNWIKGGLRLTAIALSFSAAASSLNGWRSHLNKLFKNSE